jgi:hypothetical protein
VRPFHSRRIKPFKHAEDSLHEHARGFDWGTPYKQVSLKRTVIHGGFRMRVPGRWMGALEDRYRIRDFKLNNKGETRTMKQNVELLSNKAQSRLTNKLLTLALAAFTGVTCLASVQPALTQSDDAKRFETPTVFQAAGPSAASIQSTVDQYRAALGAVNNGNNPGQTSGHREINWDGGSPTNATTSLSGTP